jgi:hypothetical protein
VLLQRLILARASEPFPTPTPIAISRSPHGSFGFDVRGV